MEKKPVSFLKNCIYPGLYSLAFGYFLLKPSDKISCYILEFVDLVCRQEAHKEVIDVEIELVIVSKIGL